MKAANLVASEPPTQELNPHPKGRSNRLVRIQLEAECFRRLGNALLNSTKALLQMTDRDQIVSVAKILSALEFSIQVRQNEIAEQR